MKKLFYSFVVVICMALVTTNVTFAKEQMLNACITLDTYKMGIAASFKSNYCTANKDHLTLTVSNATGSVSAAVQYRGPNTDWKYLTGSFTIGTGKSKKFDLNVIKRYDYRVHVESLIRGASGQVFCE